MSDCTKGKIEVSGKLPYIVAITAPPYPYESSGKTIISRGSETGGQGWPAIDIKIQEANAKELVRRWNAFEEGGIVEELKWACKKVLQYKKAAEEGRLNKDENAHEYWESVMSYVEAALAKI